MKTKKWFITILMILLVVGSLSAATPSVFDVGVLNYYKIQNLIDTDFTPYTPGVRMEAHIRPWFGLGLDTILDKPFSQASGDYVIVATTDVSFRAPLGFFEPFLAIGPAYTVTISGGAVALAANVSYSARAGFDFNITPVFTIGAEGKLIVNNLTNIVENGFASVDWLDSTYVGITLKAKF